MTINAEIDQEDRVAIDKVLAANGKLNNMWQWIAGHQFIQFIVRRAQEGFCSVNAELPRGALEPGLIQQPVEISLTLNPMIASSNQRKPEESVLEALSHELNLHLLPWSRVMMFKELSSFHDGANADAYGEHRINQIRAVLGNLDDEPGRAQVLRHVKADAANKSLRVLTNEVGGNHSDLGLWLLHLLTIEQLANREEGVMEKTRIVTTGINKMALPMLLYGKPEHAIARDEDTPVKFLAVLGRLSEQYSQHVAEGQDREFFASNVARIRTQVGEYTAVTGPLFTQDLPALYANPAMYGEQ